MTVRQLPLVVLLAGLLAGPATAGIVFDYSDDVAGSNFFGNNPTAKAALEAAAADINAVLDLNLGAITNDVVSGDGGGGTTLNFDFSYGYSNPSSGASVTINDTTLPSNEIRIFVGARNLSGSLLGQGGPGGSGFSVGGFIGSGPLSSAIAQAEASYEHRRGDGPTINTLEGNLSGGGQSADYSFAMGPTVGNLWFDQDTNNDGVTDDQATLEDNWHFDHTSDVAAGKDDFYSVALHEILHSIGFGTSQTWDELVNGTDWLGDEVITLNGTGTGIIDSGSGHFTQNLMSTRLSDGMMQEVVMDPNLTVGTRKSLTALDVALLRDLGYSTSVTAIPEPSAFAVMLVIGSWGALSRRRRR